MAKKKYVINDQSQYSALKHLRDLIMLGVPREELDEVIRISWINGNHDGPVEKCVAKINDDGSKEVACVKHKLPVNCDFDDYLEEDDLPF